MTAVDYKQQAIECWTTAPCGPDVPGAEPGTREYFDALVAGRREYAPWMAEALGYDQTSGLDVLDVGCGQGIDLYEYASRGARVTGIDLTPRHVELATAHLAAAGVPGQVKVGDAERLDFPDRTFDRVSSNGVLHHTPNIDAAMGECLRVLRPGGVFTVILYNRNSAHYWLTQVLGHGLMEGRLFRMRSMQDVMSSTVEAGSLQGARPLVRVYQPHELRGLVTAAGFTSVEVFVRHLRWEDLHVPLLRRNGSSPPLDALGRSVGWYVIARAVRPAE